MFTVLVCDDDAAILESLRIYLSQEGYRVLCARDGLDALAWECSKLALGFLVTAPAAPREPWA